MKILLILSLTLLLHAQSITIQILGSGGPEFSERASSSYLIWVDGKAKVLVDTGGGSFLRFTQSGAKLKDLEVIALTHLHIDHSADLPQFMKAGFFTNRTQMLPILGTTGVGDFPNIKTYLNRLFGKNGAYAYMQDILTSQSDSFEIKPIMLDQNLNSISIGAIKITSIGVQHGRVPAIAYAFEIDGKKIVFSGDTSANSENIIKLANDADYLIAHHAIPQHSGKFAKRLHMTPKRIGEVAQKVNVKHLILSHRMKRTYDKEMESEKLIRENFNKEIIWAEDLMRVDAK
jgi:ribonuclease BN (tRNA processing enzyme)